MEVVKGKTTTVITISVQGHDIALAKAISQAIDAASADGRYLLNITGCAGSIVMVFE